ncbi:MAG: hypothetical protein O2816_19345 [Planctomycetota bacterium]|nr:hypothetical protein [Planctomycetota bacterium]
MSATQVTALLAEDTLDLANIASALDAMADADRVVLVRSWDGKVQRKLFP